MKIGQTSELPAGPIRLQQVWTHGSDEESIEEPYRESFARPTPMLWGGLTTALPRASSGYL